MCMLEAVSSCSMEVGAMLAAGSSGIDLTLCYLELSSVKICVSNEEGTSVRTSIGVHYAFLCITMGLAEKDAVTTDCATGAKRVTLDYCLVVLDAHYSVNTVVELCAGGPSGGKFGAIAPYTGDSKKVP